MFTKKEILREIRESTSKARIYRKSQSRIFWGGKISPARKLILAKN